VSIQVKNKWKTVFWILLAVNIAAMIAILTLAGVFSTPPGVHFTNELQKRSESKFTITSTKEDLTQTINSYLHRTAKRKKGDYYVSLDKDVRFLGTITAFGRKIDMEMNFQPVVLDNGDLLLQTKAMYIGTLPLPVTTVLDYIRKKYTFPEWVAIRPKEERIYVYLTKMKTKSDFRMKMIEFDLVNDSIKLELLVPNYN
jgi:uncharacterized protein YpmS